MKNSELKLYTKDFRDREKVDALLGLINKESDPLRTYRFMEVCGSHTMAVSRFGLRSILPENVHLISGPGCPVCVTPQCEIDAVFDIVKSHDCIVATFGDMLKVPGSKGENLEKLRAQGADIRVVFSPLDALKIAKETEKEVVFIGVGFETTAPTCAALIKTAYESGVKNISVTPYNKTMPEVLGLLLSDENLDIDGFVCPGHVSAITGLGLYDPVIESSRAAVITGFEPVDILMSVLEMIRQVNSGKFEIVNRYGRVVKKEGNSKALALLDEVFEKRGCYWRGIGFIENSGLFPQEKYVKFNAFEKFGLDISGDDEIAGCRCGDVLKGYIKPMECSLFGNGCTPENPVGPCMVSSEGSCSAYYKYGG